MKSFDSAQSALMSPGPRNEPTEAYPKRQHTGMLNAAGSYHVAALLPPGTLEGEAPWTRSGRWVKSAFRDALLETEGEKARPDSTLVTPLNIQPAKTYFFTPVTPEPNGRPGP